MSKPKLRKVNKAARKAQRQEATARLQKQTAMFLDHPKECCLCEGAFERNKETVKTWHVTVRGERVHLTCPGCWTTLSNALEKLSGKD